MSYVEANGEGGMQVSNIVRGEKIFHRRQRRTLNIGRLVPKNWKLLLEGEGKGLKARSFYSVPDRRERRWVVANYLT